jgi:hypothetical protein
VPHPWEEGEEHQLASAQTVGTVGLLQVGICGEQVLVFVPSKKCVSFAVFIGGGVDSGDGAGW